MIDKRTKFTDLNIRISKFIEWQETKDGRKANLPEIEETHEDILFTYWDARIKKDELAVAREVGVSKNIIKVVNHTLFVTNLLKEDNLKEMPELGALHKNWQEKAKTQREAITKLTKTIWESYWQYLVKPHIQIMTLNCSLHLTQQMLPPLTDAIFVGQLRTHFGAPPQLKPMTDICDLKDKLADKKSSS